MSGRRLMVAALAGVAAALVLSAAPWRSRPPHVGPNAGASSAIVDREPAPARATFRRTPASRPPRFQALMDQPPPAPEAHDTWRDVLRSVDLDVVHPGLAAAYRAGMEQSAAEFAHRAQLRCILQLPDQALDIEWESVLRFEPDQSGLAVLTDLQTSAADPASKPFHDCLEQELLGRLRFRLPEDFSGPLQIRDASRIILDPAITAGQIQTQIAALEQQLGNPGLTAPRRALLQQRLALWTCYDRRGSQHRRQCMQELASDG